MVGKSAAGWLAVILAMAVPPPGRASTEAPRPDRPPQVIYDSFCATCHDSGRVPRAPHRVRFPQIGPNAILAALETGAMSAQGATLTPGERRSIAEYLGEAKLAQATPPAIKRCAAGQSRFDFNRPPALAGWGMTLDGSRYVAQPALRAADVPRLKLKWAFAYPGATRARSQPAVGGGALYVGGQDGTVYALDLASGCARWTFKADAEVRSSPTLEPWSRGNRLAHPRLYFGDFVGNAYALDAQTGTMLWKSLVDPHPRVTITGSPRLYAGRLYVPMSSNEWLSAADPTYECCKFRGGVAALDAGNGQLIWKSYTIQQPPQATGERNSAGAARYHPAGAPVWNSPTIDVKRKRLYVGSGEAYTSPAAPQSDAVLAYDLETGRLLWWYQSLPKDAWNMACFIGDGANCPVENGPDLDIGAQTILHRLPSGKDVVLAGQKSSDVFALDPDDGKLLWKVKLGRGGYIGGVHWGIAASPDTLFAPVADTTITGTEKGGEPKPGMFALDPATGRIKWYAPAPETCAPDRKPACDRGYSAPPTAIPGAVFQGALDGRIRALRASDGKILWEFDTLQELDTVSGEKAHGGSIENAGPVVTEGLVIVNSGYLFGGRMAGNALLVFSVDGR